MLIPGIPLVLTLRVKNVFDQKIKKMSKIILMKASNHDENDIEDNKSESKINRKKQLF